MKKRLLTILTATGMAMVFLCSLFAFAAAPEKEPLAWEPYHRNPKAERAYEQVAQVGGLTLEADCNHGAIRVKGEDGTLWSSTPEQYEADELANGGAKMNMASLIYVTYADKVGNPKMLNSYAGSVKKGSYGCMKIENGIRFVFYFERIGMTVPVDIYLTEQGLEASVLADEILEEDETYSLLQVSLMPYFGAAVKEDEGYLFLPDGSGALVEFDRAPYGAEPYEQTVYGPERAISKRKAEAKTEHALLPVYGVKKGDQAFLAVIKAGDAHGILHAQAAGDRTSYFNVWSDFSYRITDLILVEKKNQQVRMTQENHTDAKRYTVLYQFLSGDRADYNGMAKAYQTYLEEQGMSRTKYPADELFLTFVGGAEATVNRMGFPVDEVQKFTTFSDAKEILKDLKGKGIVHVSAAYEAWNKGGAQAPVPDRLAPEKNLGGKEAFDDLISYCREQKISLYPAVDPAWIYQNRMGVFGPSDGVKNIQKGPAEQYIYRLSDGGANVTMPQYLLRQDKVLEICKKLADSRNTSYPDLPGLDASRLGSTLYSDFGRDSISREQAEKYFTDGLTVLKGDGALLMRAPCAYAVLPATAATDLPDRCSHFSMETREIPFYAMALRGYLPLSSSAVNEKSDRREALLGCARMGLTPHFRVLAENENMVYKTCLTDLTCGLYADWAEDVQEAVSFLKPALEAVGDASVDSFVWLDEGVSKTVFANGTIIYVNETEADQTVDGVMVSARQYAVKAA